MADRMREVTDRWRDHGFDVEMTDLWYAGDRNDVVDYLDTHGWATTATSVPELFAAYGLSLPADTGDGDGDARLAALRHRYPELDAARSSPTPSAASNALIIHSLIAAASTARFSRLMMPCPSLPKSR